MDNSGLIVVLVIAFFIIVNSIRILPEYKRAVVFRLGRLLGQRGPGIVVIIPNIDRIVVIDLRPITLDVPPQEILTQDKVTLSVSAECNFNVIDPIKAVVDSFDFIQATSKAVQSTMRITLGQMELDEILKNREKINQNLQQLINQQSTSVGINVFGFEIKDIGLPDEMKPSVAKQREIERKLRAKVITGERDNLVR